MSVQANGSRLGSAVSSLRDHEGHPRVVQEPVAQGVKVRTLSQARQPLELHHQLLILCVARKVRKQASRKGLLTVAWILAAPLSMQRCWVQNPFWSCSHQNTIVSNRVFQLFLHIHRFTQMPTHRPITHTHAYNVHSYTLSHRHPCAHQQWLRTG